MQNNHTDILVSVKSVTCDLLDVFGYNNSFVHAIILCEHIKLVDDERICILIFRWRCGIITGLFGISYICISVFFVRNSVLLIIITIVSIVIIVRNACFIAAFRQSSIIKIGNIGIIVFVISRGADICLINNCVIEVFFRTVQKCKFYELLAVKTYARFIRKLKIIGHLMIVYYRNGFPVYVYCCPCNT